MARSRCRLLTLAALLALPAGAAAQVRAGGELVVNTTTAGDQADPAIAAGRGGRFVVAWTYPPTLNAFDIKARVYAAGGVALGAEFAVNTYTTGAQLFPDVGMDAAGNFLVVWSGDTSRPGVFGQRFDAIGLPRGAEFQVNSIALPGFTQQTAAVNADGSFVVTWTSTLGISARRFDSTGAPSGAEFQVNASTPLTINNPVVAADAAGNFVVVWEVALAPFDKDLFGRLFTAAGAPVGGDFAVNAYTTGRQAQPAIARTAQGAFVVSWNGTDGSGYGIVGQRFDAAGARVGNEFVANTYTPDQQVQSSVAVDQSGAFVIAWRSNYQDGFASAVAAQRFDAQGARRGAEFIVNLYTTSYQSFPDVASDANGNFVVAWQSDGQDGNGYGVIHQRFGGLHPAALAVDPAGNNVLEPVEVPRIAPSWSNPNNSAQAFGGGLANFTSAVSATHTIVDAIADYGTVGAGLTGSCGTNCYQVTVSQPAARPIHWDAFATETITPDAHGQTKTWTLHVGRSFADVPATSPFYRFVETMLHNDVAAGCGGANFCPSSAITRAQIAVFGVRALDPAFNPPACAPPNMFNDVPETSPFCRWVEELARRGVVGGCGNGNFCPDAPVTREQMPVIVLRLMDPTLNPPPCVPPNEFNDVPETSPFCRWIEHMFQQGGTAGCGGGNYCPLATITREQMSVFMTVAFGLTLYGV